MGTESPLHAMVRTTRTDFWNDSCAVDELEYAIANGGTGATSNPQIVLGVLRKETAAWRERVRALAGEMPAASESDLAWRVIEEMAVRGAAVLDPVFRREHGRKGRLSVQVDPTLYRDADAMVAHAVRLASLAPNVQVKLPATAAGIRAIEEATRRGVNVNATVSFTVSQAIAVAEAIERGLDRRAETGLPVADMTPVCTIMVGRLDDWIQVLCERDGIVADPAHVARAGVAAFKKAYGIFRQRGFRTRLLAAAYRHQLHWTEFVGADVVLTMPSPWQKRFNASGIEPVPRIDEPVDPAALAALYARFPDFRRAYDEDGMTVQQFDSFGPTVRTLRTFIASYHELQGLIRDFVLPDPDKAMA